MILKSSIVGMKFHEGAHDKLLASPAGTVVTLVREPENAYDPNAIRCDIDGQKCGYIPKAQAERLAEDLDAGRDIVVTLKDYNKLEIDVGGEAAPAEEDTSDVGDLI